MIRLSREQVLMLHHQLIERYGGSHGIRDEGLLEFRRNGELFLGRDASHSCDGKRHMDVHAGKKKSACI